MKGEKVQLVSPGKGGLIAARFIRSNGKSKKLFFPKTQKI